MFLAFWETFRQNFDIFGIYTQLNYKGNRKFNTYPGFILTITCVALGLLGFIYFGQDLFQKINPETNISTLFQHEPSLQDLSPKDYSFVFAIEHTNGSFWKLPSIANIKLQYFQYKRVNSELQLEITNISFVDCTDEYFDELDPSLVGAYEQLNLANAYCLPNNLSLKIGGSFESQFFYYIRISLEKCQNTTDNQQCQPIEVIEKILDQGYVALFMKDRQIEPREYKDYKRYSIRSIFTNFARNYQKAFDINLQAISMKTDLGVIWSDFKEESSINFESSREYNFFQTKNQFFYADIKLSQFQKTYQRQYMKLQDLFANVGGLLNVIIIIAYLCCFPFVKLHYNLSLINDLYDIKIKDQNKKQQQKKINNFEKGVFPKKSEFPKKESNDNINNISNINNQLNIKNQLNFYLSEQKNHMKQSTTLGSNLISIDNKKAQFLQQQQQQQLQIEPNSEQQRQFNPGELSQSHIQENQSSPQQQQSTQKKFNFAKCFINYILNYFLFKIEHVRLEQKFLIDETNSCSCKSLNEIQQSQTIQQQQQHKSDEKQQINEQILDINNQKKSIQLSQSTKPKLKLNIFEQFNYIFQCIRRKKNSQQSRKSELIELGLKRIQHKLDIRYILSKLQELEKIKILLFTEDELDIFFQLPKPKLILNQQNKLLEAQSRMEKIDVHQYWNKIENQLDQEGQNAIEKNLHHLSKQREQMKQTTMNQKMWDMMMMKVADETKSLQVSQVLEKQ